MPCSAETMIKILRDAREAHDRWLCTPEGRAQYDKELTEMVKRLGITDEAWAEAFKPKPDPLAIARDIARGS